MTRFIAVLVAFFFVAVGRSAVSAMTIFGAGSSRCGDMNMSYLRNDQFKQFLFEQWILGFWTGLNEGLASDGKQDTGKTVLSGQGTDILIEDIKQECRRAPSKFVKDAVGDTWSRYARDRR